MGGGAGNKKSATQPTGDTESPGDPAELTQDEAVERRKRITENVITGVIVLVIGGVGGYFFREWAPGPKPPSRAELIEVDKDLKALKCFIYGQEYGEFYAKCRRDGEPMPNGSCFVDGETEPFLDPLPEIEVDIREDCRPEVVPFLSLQ